MPDSDWESLCAQDCCDAFRFEIADLALRHLKAHQLLHHTQRICTGLKKVFSAPECAAAALLFALVLESLSTCLVSPALLRGLGALNYRAHEWLRPSVSQRRVAGRAKCELWTWLLGVSRWLLLTAWQLHAGSRRRKVARRRLQFLPEAVRNSVQTGWWPPVAVPKAFDAFVSLQVTEPLKPQCLDAVVYIVGGRHKEVYIGYSSHMRASKSARLGAPVPRVNEHFYEASCVDRCGAACAKSRLLKLESPCDLGALVVFAGPDLQARAFEKTLIASLQPALNTLWHGPTMGRPPLANKARDSFGAASRRRPHKHARQVGQAGLTEGPRDDEISRLVQVDVRRRAGQIRAKARESVSISLLSRPFPVLYALCLAAHVQEHGTYGPVNVFGQLSHLLVAWICYRPAFQFLVGRCSWSWLIGSFGSHLALSFLERRLGNYSPEDACVCDCFRGPPDPCRPRCAAFRDEDAANTCSIDGIGGMPHVNSQSKLVGLKDPSATQLETNLFHSVLHSSHWVVDGYSMLVTAILWWHRRPRRL